MKITLEEKDYEDFIEAFKESYCVELTYPQIDKLLNNAKDFEELIKFGVTDTAVVEQAAEELAQIVLKKRWPNCALTETEVKVFFKDFKKKAPLKGFKICDDYDENFLED